MRIELASIRYTNIPSEFQAALQWLDELEIRYSLARFNDYRTILDTLESARVAGTNLFVAAKGFNAFPALFEANDLATIHEGLAGRSLSAPLRRKLAEIVEGPHSYVEENPKSGTNQPRNTAFELSVTAQLTRAGFAVQQDDGLADVVAFLGSSKVILECKRPQSKTGVSTAIRKARDQLDTRYQNPYDADATGFIALDVTKLLNPDFLIATEEPVAAMKTRIDSAMNELIEDHNELWDRVRDQRTAGVLLRYSELAWSEQRRTMEWRYKYGVSPFTRRSDERVSVVKAVEAALNRLALSDGTPIA